MFELISKERIRTEFMNIAKSGIGEQIAMQKVADQFFMNYAEVRKIIYNESTK